MDEYLHKKIIEIPIYKGTFIIVFSNSKNKVNELTGISSNNIYAHAVDGTYKNKQAFFIILNFDNKYDKITHGVINHEIIHICHFIFEKRDIILSYDNDEPITYLAEYLTNEVYKYINQLNFKVH